MRKEVRHLIVNCSKLEDQLRKSPKTLCAGRVSNNMSRILKHYLRNCHLLSFKQYTGKPLPLTCTPIKFGSWMGGDRDGNANVTAKVQCSLNLHQNV